MLLTSQDGSLYALGPKIPTLGPGGTARVAQATSLRGAPASTAVERAVLEPGTVVTISNEAERAGTTTWWPVVVDETGAHGWIEASKLEPVRSGPDETPDPA